MPTWGMGALPRPGRAPPTSGFAGGEGAPPHLLTPWLTWGSGIWLSQFLARNRSMSTGFGRYRYGQNPRANMQVVGWVPDLSGITVGTLASAAPLPAPSGEASSVDILDQVHENSLRRVCLLASSTMSARSNASWINVPSAPGTDGDSPPSDAPATGGDLPPIDAPATGGDPPDTVGDAAATGECPMDCQSEGHRNAHWDSEGKKPENRNPGPRYRLFRPRIRIPRVAL